MQTVQIGIGIVPEGFNCLVVIVGNLFLAFAFTDNGLNVSFFLHGISEMSVTVCCCSKEFILQVFVTIEIGFQRQNLRFGNAALQMGFHILWRRRLGIIHIAADIAVVVLGGQRLTAHQSAITVNLNLVVIGITDFLNVFGTERVLVLPLLVLAVGIDEKHALSTAGSRLVDDQQRSRDTRAIEQSLRQPDDTFEDA